MFLKTQPRVNDCLPVFGWSFPVIAVIWSSTNSNHLMKQCRLYHPRWNYVLYQQILPTPSCLKSQENINKWINNYVRKDKQIIYQTLNSVADREKDWGLKNFSWIASHILVWIIHLKTFTFIKLKDKLFRWI